MGETVKKTNSVINFNEWELRIMECSQGNMKTRGYESVLVGSTYKWSQGWTVVTRNNERKEAWILVVMISYMEW